jgi:SAM-dependent methyltransferase
LVAVTHHSLIANSSTDLYYDWDYPCTAHFYEQFYCSHPRYQLANEALIRHAALAPGQKVLDFAAGTGRTAETALPLVGEEGHILCVEPAAAMRARGQARLVDPRVQWAKSCPAEGLFDRILCGAAIWQMSSLESTIAWLAARLSPGGALCFNIPALYLGRPDEPGGGSDPLLLELPALLSNGSQANEADNSTADSPASLDEASVARFLEAAGLQPESWSFRLRLTQEAYRDWLKIPVLTNRLLAGLHPLERVRRIEAAYRESSQDSWRWECWRGWTAWKDED